MIDRQLSPDAQLQHDELTYVLRGALAGCDAENAVDTLDALLTAYRDQVLTEAAEMLRNASVGCHETDGVYAAADLLLAARTGQEAPATPAADRLREVIRDTAVSLEQYHDRLVFEYPDVADALQPLIDRLNHATSQES